MSNEYSKFDLPRASQWDITNRLLAKIAGETEIVIPIKDWQDVQIIVNMGIARQTFNVGEVLMSTYLGVPIYNRIIGFDHEDTGNPLRPRSMTLQPMDIVDDAIQFSAPQALCNAGETGITAGTHYFTLNAQQYEVTLTKPVPEDGILFISTFPTKMASYEADRVTAIETGLDITTTSGQADTLTMDMNHHSRCEYGSNNYVESALRQWLNYDGENFIHTFKTQFDRPSAYPATGFLKRLDPELVAVLGTVNKTVSRNTVNEEGGHDSFSDKVFLLSRVEMGYSTEGNIGTEVVYEYWNGKTNADKIMGAPSRWWLRSPYPSTSNIVRSVTTTGEIDYNTANYTYRLAPAYAIIQTIDNPTP